jgi:phosphoribosylanthranilate isomerase
MPEQINQVMKVKVCGINDSRQLKALSTSDVDMIGLNFYNKSQRYVIADDLASVHVAEKEIVGVFVNESTETISNLNDIYNFSYIQCHGHESIEICKEIQNIQKIIKVFSIAKKQDIEATQEFGFADLFLFDTQTKEYGGSGKKFDWNLLDAYRGNVPFLLAGGISPEDTGAVKSITHPQFYGLDINSKFENRPGYKDLIKVDTFIKEIKSTL